MTATMPNTRWTKDQTTVPTAEPIKLEEAKAQCRVTSDAEDGHIELCIAAARQRAEHRCGLQFMLATWKMYLDGFPDEIRPPQPPLLSVSSITYVDTSGSTQTLSASAYSVDAVSFPARIVPAYGTAWPATRGMLNDVTVTYTAGYGATNALCYTNMAAKVPDAKLAMLGYVSHWFENREPVNIGNIVNPLPMMGDDLIDQLWHGHLW